MVKIRLYRTGATKRPSYRIVAIDSRRKRQGRTLDVLGTYEPQRGGAVHLRRDALERWLGQGAQMTETVRSLLRRAHDAGAPAEAEGGDAETAASSAS
jgi:small subunit ribosomal protein S16